MVIVRIILFSTACHGALVERPQWARLRWFARAFILQNALGRLRFLQVFVCMNSWATCRGKCWPRAEHAESCRQGRASDRISILLVIITLFVIIPAVVIVILIVTMSLLIFCLPAFRYHRLVSIMLATPTLLITFVTSAHT